MTAFLRLLPALALLASVPSDASADQVAAKRVSSKDGTVSFEVPPDWSGGSKGPKGDALLHSMGVAKNGVASVSLNRKRPAAMPSTQVLANEVKAGFGMKGAVVASGQTTIGRNVAHWVSLRTAATPSSKPWRVMLFVFTRNQDVYWLACHCDERDFARLEPVFRESAKSLRVP